MWRDRTLSDLQDDVFLAIVPEYASVLHLSELITAKTSQGIEIPVIIIPERSWFMAPRFWQIAI